MSADLRSGGRESPLMKRSEILSWKRNRSSFPIRWNHSLRPEGVHPEGPLYLASRYMGQTHPADAPIVETLRSELASGMYREGLKYPRMPETSFSGMAQMRKKPRT